VNWQEALTLFATVLVSGAVLAYVFQWVKAVVVGKWRGPVFWVICIVVALAEAWLADKLSILAIVQELNAGTATAAEIIGFGSAIFGTANVVYNLWVGPRALAKAREKRAH
jgi:hypothetical protein